MYHPVSLFIKKKKKIILHFLFFIHYFRCLICAWYDIGLRVIKWELSNDLCHELYRRHFYQPLKIEDKQTMGAIRLHKSELYAALNFKANIP